MSKVFVEVGLSIDGYMTGPNRGPENPLGDRGTDIHKWVFRTATFSSASACKAASRPPTMRW